MEEITVNGLKYFLLPHEFWHLIDEGSFLKNNILVGKGIIRSASLHVALTGNDGFTTPYGAQAMLQEKEQLWEEVRKGVDERLPGRMKSFYVFPQEQFASAANDQWFDGRRELVRLRIVDGSTVYTADSRFLNCNQPEWQTNAERYWRGERTDDPLPETLVHGTVYFPDWETLGEIWKP